jgi:YopX protein
MSQLIKIRIAYRSSNTDEPNKWLISEPLSPDDLINPDNQVDFTDGGYLRFHELDDGESILRWEQWTGLFDSAGRAIYEGDIISYDYDLGVSPRGGPVTWSEYSDGEYADHLDCWMVGGAPLSCLIKYASCGYGMTSNVVPDSVRVVGNIHQHPHLLIPKAT